MFSKRANNHCILDAFQGKTCIIYCGRRETTEREDSTSRSSLFINRYIPLINQTNRNSETFHIRAILTSQWKSPSERKCVGQLLKNGTFACIYPWALICFYTGASICLHTGASVSFNTGTIIRRYAVTLVLNSKIFISKQPEVLAWESQNFAGQCWSDNKSKLVPD